MQAAGRGIAGYLELFRTRRAELLDRGDPAGYDKRVATTWALAFAELGRAGPAVGLLRLAACCAAEDIPLHLLLRPGSGLAGTSRPRWRRCWSRCLTMPWRVMRRWPGCGVIR